MSVWNGKTFFADSPETKAAQDRSARRTVDQKHCGCDAKPAVSQRTTDALLPLGDNRGYWRVKKKL
jgi:hypothetical protein